MNGSSEKASLILKYKLSESTFFFIQVAFFFFIKKNDLSQLMVFRVKSPYRILLIVLFFLHFSLEIALL